MPGAAQATGAPSRVSSSSSDFSARPQSSAPSSAAAASAQLGRAGRALAGITGGVKNLGAGGIKNVPTNMANETKHKKNMLAREGLKTTHVTNTSNFETLKAKLATMQAQGYVTTDLVAQLTGVIDDCHEKTQSALDSNKAASKSNQFEDADRAFTFAQQWLAHTATQLSTADDIMAQINVVSANQESRQPTVASALSGLSEQSLLPSEAKDKILGEVAVSQANADQAVLALKGSLGAIGKETATQAFESAQSWQANTSRLLTAAERVPTLVQSTAASLASPKREAVVAQVSHLAEAGLISNENAQDVKNDLTAKAQVAQTAFDQYKQGLVSTPLLNMGALTQTLSSAQTALNARVSLNQAYVVRVEAAVVHRQNQKDSAEVVSKLTAVLQNPSSGLAKTLAETAKSQIEVNMHNTSRWIEISGEKANDPVEAETVALATKGYVTSLSEDVKTANKVAESLG